MHPESVHQLYETILSISEKHQVVLTTHSPLFVNRMNLNENIIVSQGKAISVKRTNEIRDVLRIYVSDNLTNAENVLLVEGDDDKIVLEKLLPNLNEKIRQAMNSGNFIIVDVGGAGNIAYMLSFYRNLQCKCHVFLDYDEEGRVLELLQKKRRTRL